MFSRLLENNITLSPSMWSWTLSPSSLYSAANSFPNFSTASLSLFILSANIGLIGSNIVISNSSIPLSPFAAIVSATFPKSFETLYACCKIFLFSLLPENAIANASITVFSATPSLRVPSNIFKTYFASSGLASFSKLEMYFIFISCDRAPPRFAILNNVS